MLIEHHLKGIAYNALTNIITINSIQLLHQKVIDLTCLGGPAMAERNNEKLYEIVAAI